MTKRFNVFYTCQHCGKRSTAETAFGRWVRGNQALDSVSGIVRTDTDHWFLRYKTSSHGREFQLLMGVEIKERGAEPDQCQTDVLSFVRQMAEMTGRNIHNAKTRVARQLYSKLLGRRVKVKWLGIHLLQFQNTCPGDSQWIRWDRKSISADVLSGVLALERDPYQPDRFMDELLRDRHSKPMEFQFACSTAGTV